MVVNDPGYVVFEFTGDVLTVSIYILLLHDPKK